MGRNEDRNEDGDVMSVKGTTAGLHVAFSSPLQRAFPLSLRETKNGGNEGLGGGKTKSTRASSLTSRSNGSSLEEGLGWTAEDFIEKIERPRSQSTDAFARSFRAQRRCGKKSSPFDEGQSFCQGPVSVQDSNEGRNEETDRVGVAPSSLHQVVRLAPSSQAGGAPAPHGWRGCNSYGNFCTQKVSSETGLISQIRRHCLILIKVTNAYLKPSRNTKSNCIFQNHYFSQKHGTPHSRELAFLSLVARELDFLLLFFTNAQDMSNFLPPKTHTPFSTPAFAPISAFVLPINSIAPAPSGDALLRRRMSGLESVRSLSGTPGHNADQSAKETENAHGSKRGRAADKGPLVLLKYLARNAALLVDRLSSSAVPRGRLTASPFSALPHTASPLTASPLTASMISLRHAFEVSLQQISHAECVAAAVQALPAHLHPVSISDDVTDQDFRDHDIAEQGAHNENEHETEDDGQYGNENGAAGDNLEKGIGATSRPNAFLNQSPSSLEVLTTAFLRSILQTGEAEGLHPHQRSKNIVGIDTCPEGARCLDSEGAGFGERILSNGRVRKWSRFLGQYTYYVFFCPLLSHIFGSEKCEWGEKCKWGEKPLLSLSCDISSLAEVGGQHLHLALGRDLSFAAVRLRSALDIHNSLPLTTTPEVPGSMPQRFQVFTQALECAWLNFKWILQERMTETGRKAGLSNLLTSSLTANLALYIFFSFFVLSSRRAMAECRSRLARQGVDLALLVEVWVQNERPVKAHRFTLARSFKAIGGPRGGGGEGGGRPRALTGDGGKFGNFPPSTNIRSARGGPTRGGSSHGGSGESGGFLGSPATSPQSISRSVGEERLAGGRSFDGSDWDGTTCLSALESAAPWTEKTVDIDGDLLGITDNSGGTDYRSGGRNAEWSASKESELLNPTLHKHLITFLASFSEENYLELYCLLCLTNSSFSNFPTLSSDPSVSTDSLGEPLERKPQTVLRFLQEGDARFDSLLRDLWTGRSGRKTRSDDGAESKILNRAAIVFALFRTRFPLPLTSSFLPTHPTCDEAAFKAGEETCHSTQIEAVEKQEVPTSFKSNSIRHIFLGVVGDIMLNTTYDFPPQLRLILRFCNFVASHRKRPSNSTAPSPTSSTSLASSMDDGNIHESTESESVALLPFPDDRVVDILELIKLHAERWRGSGERIEVLVNQHVLDMKKLQEQNEAKEAGFEKNAESLKALQRGVSQLERRVTEISEGAVNRHSNQIRVIIDRLDGARSDLQKHQKFTETRLAALTTQLTRLRATVSSISQSASMEPRSELPSELRSDYRSSPASVDRRSRYGSHGVDGTATHRRPDPGGGSGVGSDVKRDRAEGRSTRSRTQWSGSSNKRRSSSRGVTSESQSFSSRDERKSLGDTSQSSHSSVQSQPQSSPQSQSHSHLHSPSHPPPPCRLAVMKASTHGSIRSYNTGVVERPTQRQHAQSYSQTHTHTHTYRPRSFPAPPIAATAGVAASTALSSLRETLRAELVNARALVMALSDRLSLVEDGQRDAALSLSSRVASIEDACSSLRLEMSRIREMTDLNPSSNYCQTSAYRQASVCGQTIEYGQNAGYGHGHSHSLHQSHSHEAAALPSLQALEAMMQRNRAMEAQLQELRTALWKVSEGMKERQHGAVAELKNSLEKTQATIEVLMFRQSNADRTRDQMCAAIDTLRQSAYETHTHAQAAQGELSQTLDILQWKELERYRQTEHSLESINEKIAQLWHSVPRQLTPPGQQLGAAAGGDTETDQSHQLTRPENAPAVPSMTFGTLCESDLRTVSMPESEANMARTASAIQPLLEGAQKSASGLAPLSASESGLDIEEEVEPTFTSNAIVDLDLRQPSQSGSESLSEAALESASQLDSESDSGSDLESGSASRCDEELRRVNSAGTEPATGRACRASSLPLSLPLGDFSDGMPRCRTSQESQKPVHSRKARRPAEDVYPALFSLTRRISAVEKALQNNAFTSFFGKYVGPGLGGDAGTERGDELAPRPLGRGRSPGPVPRPSVVTFAPSSAIASASALDSAVSLVNAQSPSPAPDVGLANGGKGAELREKAKQKEREKEKEKEKERLRPLTSTASELNVPSFLHSSPESLSSASLLSPLSPAPPTPSIRSPTAENLSLSSLRKRTVIRAAQTRVLFDLPSDKEGSVSPPASKTSPLSGTLSERDRDRAQDRGKDRGKDRDRDRDRDGSRRKGNTLFRSVSKYPKIIAVFEGDDAETGTHTHTQTHTPKHTHATSLSRRSFFFPSSPAVFLKRARTHESPSPSARRKLPNKRTDETTCVSPALRAEIPPLSILDVMPQRIRADGVVARNPASPSVHRSLDVGCSTMNMDEL